MRVGESIKKGFEIAVKSMDLIGVLFVFSFIWNLINVLYAQNVQNPNAINPALVAAAVVFVLLTIFFQAGSLAYIRDRIKTGASSLAAFFKAGGAYYFPLLVIAVIVTAIIVVFILLATLGSFWTRQVPVLPVVLALLFAAFGIYFVILLFLAPYIAVADNQGPIASIKKSVGAVRQNILPLVLIFLILLLIFIASAFILGAIFAIISVGIKGLTAQVIFALLGSLVNSFLGVFMSSSFMGYYLGKSSSSQGSCCGGQTA